MYMHILPIQKESEGPQGGAPLSKPAVVRVPAPAPRPTNPRTRLPNVDSPGPIPPATQFLAVSLLLCFAQPGEQSATMVYIQTDINKPKKVTRFGPFHRKNGRDLIHKSTQKRT
jgi:hypothetical protein